MPVKNIDCDCHVTKSTTFIANGKSEIHVYVFFKNEYIDDNNVKIILAVHADAELPSFSEKLKTASGKCRINMVTWSSL